MQNTYYKTGSHLVIHECLTDSSVITDLKKTTTTKPIENNTKDFWTYFYLADGSIKSSSQRVVIQLPQLLWFLHRK